MLFGIKNKVLIHRWVKLGDEEEKKISQYRYSLPLVSGKRPKVVYRLGFDGLTGLSHFQHTAIQWIRNLDLPDGRPVL